MKRKELIESIVTKLSVWAYSVQAKQKSNLLDDNIYSETFVCALLNNVWGYSFTNQNTTKSNVKGVDALDETNQFCLQVSARTDAPKIRDSLKNCDAYKGFTFVYFAISTETEALKKLRRASYDQSLNGVNFHPSEHIWAIDTIVQSLPNIQDIDDIAHINNLLEKEIPMPSARMFNSGIAQVIACLCKETLKEVEYSPKQFTEFSIDDKISYNDLVAYEDVMATYAQFISQLEEQYDVLNAEVPNGKMSILMKIQGVYLDKKREGFEGVDMFVKIEEEIKNIITEDLSKIDSTTEVIDTCIRTIVVDAFMRCKIFEKPPVKEKPHATT